MGYFTIRPTQYGSGLLYLPDFKPRKAEFGKMLGETAGEVGGQAVQGAGSGKRSVADLPPGQREAFREQLHNGCGTLTLQEWDDFLADLVEWGIITNDERYFANGVMLEVPEGVKKEWPDATDADSDVIDQLWTGDPAAWLDRMDAYFLKNSFYGDMRCREGAGYSEQRDAYLEVNRIVREFLPEGWSRHENITQNPRARFLRDGDSGRIQAGGELAALSSQHLQLLRDAMYETMRKAVLAGGGERDRNRKAREAVQQLRGIVDEILC